MIPSNISVTINGTVIIKDSSTFINSDILIMTGAFINDEGGIFNNNAAWVYTTGDARNGGLIANRPNSTATVVIILVRQQ